MDHPSASAGRGTAPVAPASEAPGPGRARLAAIALLPLGWGLQALAARFPEWTEHGYARGLYPPLHRALTALTGLVPFSLAQALLLALAVVLLAWPVRAWRRWRAGERSARFLLARGALDLFAGAGLLYATFLLLWGLNYARAPYAWSADLEVRPVAAAELAEVVAALLEEANALRAVVAEDEHGVVRLAAGRSGALQGVGPAYAAASASLPWLAGSEPLVRVPLGSPLMTLVGISGVYAPWTGEAQVNAAIPDAMFPFVLCHEVAHQRGFAREDEANFIAYEVCRRSADPDFRYAGALNALGYALGALWRADAARAAALDELRSAGVRRDQAALAAFWRPRTTATRIVRQASVRVNHTYLQAQGEPEGVQSYGRMVDLLVAARRAAR